MPANLSTGSKEIYRKGARGQFLKSLRTFFANLLTSKKRINGVFPGGAEEKNKKRRKKKVRRIEKKHARDCVSREPPVEPASAYAQKKSPRNKEGAVTRARPDLGRSGGQTCKSAHLTLFGLNKKSRIVKKRGGGELPALVVSVFSG